MTRDVTINRANEETRAKFAVRILELATAGLTQEKAAETLMAEFHGIRVSPRTVSNFCHNNGMNVTWHKGVDQKAFTPNDMDPEEWDKRARKFLSEHGQLPGVPKQIQATQIEDMGFDTEQYAISLFSDYHLKAAIDRRVSGGMAEYNTKIARERLTRWRDITLRFTQMSQIVLELKHLYLFDLGDDFEGHGKMFGTQAFMLDDSVFFQYMAFVEDMTAVVLSLLQRYEKITILKVYGNHGRVSTSWKDWYGPDNIELMAWEHIADRVKQEVGGEWSYSPNGSHLLTGGRVDFVISRSWFIMLDLFGWLFYARHGHGIGDLRRTYTGAYDNKLRMNSIVGRVINYMFKAHLHEAQEAESEIAGSVIQNGCFVGPSILSLERNAAAANLPSQEFYLFHPKYGLTHHHRIHLATVDEIRQLEVMTHTESGLLPADWKGNLQELQENDPGKGPKER